MAGAYVQGAGGHGSGLSSTTFTFASNVTANDRVVVSLQNNNTGTTWPSAPTDGGSNTYERDGTPVQDAGSNGYFTWSANISGGGGTLLQVTINLGTTGGFAYEVSEHSGLSTDSTGTANAALDQHAEATGSSASPSSGATPATTAAGEYLYCFVSLDTANTDPFTPTGNVTTKRQHDDWSAGRATAVGDNTNIANGSTPTGSWSSTGNNRWGCRTIVYKLAAGAAASPAQATRVAPRTLQRRGKPQLVQPTPSSQPTGTPQVTKVARRPPARTGKPQLVQPLASTQPTGTPQVLRVVRRPLLPGPRPKLIRPTAGDAGLPAAVTRVARRPLPASPRSRGQPAVASQQPAGVPQLTRVARRPLLASPRPHVVSQPQPPVVVQQPQVLRATRKLLLPSPKPRLISPTASQQPAGPAAILYGGRKEWRVSRGARPRLQVVSVAAAPVPLVFRKAPTMKPARPAMLNPKRAPALRPAALPVLTDPREDA